MNNDYYLAKICRRMDETKGVLDVAELGSKFYTNPKVTESLVKIDDQLDKIETEARKINKLSY
jgi:hypothetical protein